MSGALRPLLEFLRRAVVLWVGTIFVVAGTAGAITTFVDWRRSVAFEREAVPTSATVVATSIEPASRDGAPRTRYLVTYRFAAPDGRTIERTEDVPVAQWEALAAHDTLEVRYRPADPDDAQLQPEQAAWVGPLLMGLTVLFVLVGVLLARPGWRRAHLIWRVHRSGVLTEAVVTDIAPAGVTVNRVPQWHLCYEFRDRDGRMQTGTSDLLAPDEAAEWRRGDRGAVRYDRGRPRDSVWLGHR